VDRTDELVEAFEASRARLQSLAHRMLGGRAAAEDAVQEAWLRLTRSDHDGIENLEAWLTTVVTRICLDQLRSHRALREQTDAELVDDVAVSAPEQDPAQQAVASSSVGSALMVVLDELAPAERVAFVLHDVFAVPFDEIAGTLDRSPAATRQLASRARRRMQTSSAPRAPDPVRQREVVAAFHSAARRGDVDGLVAVLDPDVLLRPDEAAVGLGAVGPADGVHAVIAALQEGAAAAAPALVEGLAGLAWATPRRIRGAVEFTVTDGRISAITLIGDPQRLQDVLLAA
jgi:RNA polymerase sigma-70 factor (ECF subfamily)